MTNTKYASVPEVGLVAILILAAVVVALVATDGSTGLGAGTPGSAAGTLGAAVGQTNTVTGN